MAGKLPKGRGTPLPDLKKALAAIQSYIDAGKIEEVPEGFYSREDLMKHWGRSHGFVHNIIKVSVEKGFCEVRKVKTGRVPREYYKFKQIPEYNEEK